MSEGVDLCRKTGRHDFGPDQSSPRAADLDEICKRCLVVRVSSFDLLGELTRRQYFNAKRELPTG